MLEEHQDKMELEKVFNWIAGACFGKCNGAPTRNLVRAVTPFLDLSLSRSRPS